MRKLFLTSILALLTTTLSWSQIKIGNNGGTPTSATLTLSLNGVGGGSGGSVVSSPAGLTSCSVLTSPCTASFTIGTTVTLTATPLAGSVFTGWSGPACAGSGNCVFTILSNTTLAGTFSLAGQTIIAANPYVGIDPNTAGAFPGLPTTSTPCSSSSTSTTCALNFGVTRLWDSPNAQVTFITTCTNGTINCAATAQSFNFNLNNTGFDNYTANSFKNGVSGVMFNFSRTPQQASSDPWDVSCNYYKSQGSGKANTSGTTLTYVSGSQFQPAMVGFNVIINDAPFNITAVSGCSTLGNNCTGATTSTSPGTHTSASFDVEASTQPSQQPGQCDPPSDLNANGTGTNAYFRNIVAAFAAHVNAAGYTTAHTKPEYWEPLNESDTKGFFKGTFDQQNRMVQDMNCIINTNTGTNSITSETCDAIRHGISNITFPTGCGGAFNTCAFDTSALITTPAYHPEIGSYQQCFLYCTGSCTSGSHAGDSCSQGGAAAWVQIIDEHEKPLNSITVSPAFQMSVATADVAAILQPAEAAKPLYNTEAGASGKGWLNGSCVPPSCTTPPFGNYLDGGMQASYMGVFYTISYFDGFDSTIWYNWNNTTGAGLGSLGANAGYNAIYNWLIGSTAGTCTTSAPGTSGSNLHTYTCTLTSGSGASEAIVWEDSQSCFGSSTSTVQANNCSTTTQTVGSSFTTFTPLVNMTAIPSGLQYNSGTAYTISSHHVPIGIMPLLLK